MCNACGFYCCAYDGFSRCGCDDCPEPECWDEDEFEREFGDDDGYGDDDYAASSCACPRPGGWRVAFGAAEVRR